MCVCVYVCVCVNAFGKVRGRQKRKKGGQEKKNEKVNG